MNLGRALEACCTQWRWLGPILVANVAGIVFGYYYYFDVGQFDPSSSYFRSYGWWPFISDSPNAVALMTVALLLRKLRGWSHPVLDGLAFTHMVYVGLWTTWLFVRFPEQLGTYDWGGTNNILFFSHMGMPLEALLLLPRHRISVPLGAGLALWWGLNTWLDYGPLSLRPAPFVEVDGTFVVGAVVLVVASYAAWLWAPQTRNAIPRDATV